MRLACTSFYFLLTYFRYNHIIMIETGFLSSKILFAHRKRLINVRLENFGPAAWQGLFYR